MRAATRTSSYSALHAESLANHNAGHYQLVMRRWNDIPRSGRIKTIGYGISIISVILLAIVSWKNASTNPPLAICLFGGVCTSIAGMGLRWWSYEVEEADKRH